MTNHSIQQITELMLADRTADRRATKTPGNGSASSPASVEQFELYLRTASNQRRSESRTADGLRPRARNLDDRLVDKQDPSESASDRWRTARRSESADDKRSPAKADDATKTDRRPKPADDDVPSDDWTVDDARGTDASVGTEEPAADENPVADEEADVVEDPAAESLGAAATERDTDVLSLIAGSDDPADAGVSEASVITEPAEEAETSSIDLTDTDASVEAVEENVDSSETDQLSIAQAALAGQVAMTHQPTTADDSVPETVVAQDAEAAMDATAGTAEPVSALIAEDTVEVATLPEPDPDDPVVEAADETTNGDGADSQGETGARLRDTPSDAEPATPVSALASTGAATAGTANADAAAAVTGVGEVTTGGEGTKAAGVSGTSQAEDADTADPLWRQVRRALGSIRNLPTGEQQLTIRLRPDDLGSVVVRISTGEAGTKVALVAESAAAANQLNQQRQLLVNELQDGGLRGISVDVGTGADAGQPQAEDPDSEAGQSSIVGGQGSEPGRVNADGELGGNYRGRSDRGGSEGLIDLDL